MARHCLVFGYGQVAGGGLSPQTADRCGRTLRLWGQGLVESVYLTVSASKDGVRMADAMRDYLIERGIPAERIFVDPRGGNTAGEMDAFLSMVPSESKVIFVSTWYHIPRICWLAFWRGVLPRVAVAWRKAHWKGDVLKEFLKLANAILRPRASAKVLFEAW